MQRALLAVSICLALSAAVTADSWTERDHVTRWRFKDSFRVAVVNDAKNRYEARRYVKITRGAKLVREIDSAGFGILAASPDETVFVGLSNSGLDRTAVLIFDRKGEVLLRVPHRSGSIDYCDQSITVIRKWHGSEQADVHFEAGSDINGITVLDCHGRRVNLLRAVSGGAEPDTAKAEPAR